MNMQAIWNRWDGAGAFSGVVSVTDTTGLQFVRCAGFRSRSEALPNNADTLFGIASGTKLFTGLAACRLIETGKLSLTDPICDILPYDLGRIDKRITVYHLLTHTSGVGDYLDEEAEHPEEAEQALCRQYPVYLWETLSYYLQMITPLPPKFTPGERFGYSNAGYILLGLVIEAAAGKPYQQLVADAIFKPLGLTRTGFYRMDSLPANTAFGYLADGRTNIFSLPVIGGADGGLFTCAADLAVLWHALFAGQLLHKPMLDAFLQTQIKIYDTISYGLGVYRIDRNNHTAYYAVGSDFGVDFFTAYFPQQQLTASALGNTELQTTPLLNALFQALL